MIRRPQPPPARPRAALWLAVSTLGPPAGCGRKPGNLPPAPQQPGAPDARLCACRPPAHRHQAGQAARLPGQVRRLGCGPMHGAPGAWHATPEASKAPAIINTCPCRPSLLRPARPAYQHLVPAAADTQQQKASGRGAGAVRRCHWAARAGGALSGSTAWVTCCLLHAAVACVGSGRCRAAASAGNPPGCGPLVHSCWPVRRGAAITQCMRASARQALVSGLVTRGTAPGASLTAGCPCSKTSNAYSQAAPPPRRRVRMRRRRSTGWRRGSTKS